MTELERTTLFINSDSSTIKLSNSDVYVDVPQTIMAVTDPDEYIDVCLSEFSTNRNFSSVNENNRNYSIYYNGADHIYSLNIGYPNVFDVSTSIKVALEAEFPNESFNVSYLRYTGFISIQSVWSLSTTVPTDLALNFNIEFPSNEIMGFNRDIYPFTYISASREFTLQSVKPINVIGNKKEIIIRSSLVRNNFENSVDDGMLSTDILAKIPINVQPFENISFIDNGAFLYRSRLSTKEIVGFNLRITDENNQIIGIQSNFLMTLTFYRMRKVAEEQNIGEKLNEMVDLLRMDLLRKSQKDDKLIYAD